MNISKELLSEVLGEEVLSFDPTPITDEKHNCKPTYLFVVVKDEIDLHGDHRYYNLHELAHKCKEWAIMQGIVIETYTGRQFDGKQYVYEDGYATLVKHLDMSTLTGRFHENTEPEAIFKACQWVFDNKLEEAKASTV